MKIRDFQLFPLCGNRMTVDFDKKKIIKAIKLMQKTYRNVCGDIAKMVISDLEDLKDTLNKGGKE